VGDYRILREVGRGGMGVVYEAEQVSLGRRVALKVLPRQVSSDVKTLARFRREARSAAQLHHTNIVPVFEVGKDGEVSYYAMQFIQGQGLDLVIDELRRLKDRAHPSGSAREHEPPDPPIPAGPTAPASSRHQQASRMAHSLLTGRFAPETPGSPGEAKVATANGTATAALSDRLESDGTGAPPASEPSLAASSSPPSSIVLPGGSQLSAVESGRRPFYRSVAQIGRQVAAGLAHAHARGIVHRDIKPSNLLLDTEGVVWITDFGLAKASDDRLTQSGDILGTIRYMAPERFRGEGDGRADVYALGLTLYELLTLRPAFDSPDRLKLIEQIKTEDPPRPRALDARIPRDLETIVLKASAKDPKGRYPSADALGEDLRRFLADEPIRARRVSVAGRLLRWARRNKAVAALLVSVVVTLATGFAVSTAQWIRADRHAAREAALREDLDRELHTEVALRENLARELYTSDMLAIQQAWEAGNVQRMGDLLGRHIPEPGRTDWRGFEWYVFRRNYQRAQPIRTFRVSDTAWLVAATPDGRTLATLVYVHGRLTRSAPQPADDRVDITLWDAATDWKPRTFSRSPEIFSNAIALSRDGRRFATGTGSEPWRIRIWDAATGTLRQEGPRDHGARVTMGALAFSPDGKKLLWGDEDTTVNLWDLETGEVRTFPGHKASCLGVAFDPGRRWIASASGDGTVKLWDLKTRQEVRTFPGFDNTTPSAAMNVAFSPDGRYLAAGSWDGTRMWDLTRPKEPREIELKGKGNTMTGPWLSFSPDGRYLAAGRSNTIRLWEVETGESRAVLRGHSNMVYWTTFLDGGRMLASGSEDRTVRFWDVGDALAERDVITGVGSWVFTPDGQILASGGSDGRIRRWDVASGRPLGELKTHGITKPVGLRAISHDGRTLADPRVGLLDLKTGRLLELASEKTDAGPAAFSPVEAIVAIGHSGYIRLQDAVTGKVLRSLMTSPGLDVNSLAFTPDGRVLASAGEDQIVTLWEVTTGRPLTSNLLGHTGAISSLAFAPDGRTLVSGGREGTVILWDVADPTRASLRWKLEGNAGAVETVAYAPDGKTIASVHEDGTIKLWDPATGRERCTLVSHTGGFGSLAFSPDGSVMASGDVGGTIRLWRRWGSETARQGKSLDRP
jgi:WD40 repeat protein